MPPTPTDLGSEYLALTKNVGLVDFSNRTQIELTGADRAQFLHNFSTNAVRDLPVGKGCESFILNVKGHVIGHVYLFVCPNSIVLETVPDQAEKLLAHLDRYLIREDVQFTNRSHDWAEFYLAGMQSESLQKNLGIEPPQSRLDHTSCQLAGINVWLRRVDFTSPVGFLIACQREHAAKLQTELVNLGAIPCGLESFDVARIESGTPLFGRDITDENLPQEIDRDRLAISFTKGCYLGQETVARIDALGHVNRLLRAVKFPPQSPAPPVGTELQTATEGQTTAKTIGRITSVCHSPKLNAPLALAFISRSSAAPGTKLQSEFGPAEVIALPLAK